MQLMTWAFCIMCVLCTIEYLYCHKRTHLKRHRNTKKIGPAAILAISLLIFVSAFRNGFVDTNTYRLMYVGIGTSFNNVINQIYPIESGFLFLMWMLNIFTGDSQLLLIVTSITINILIAYEVIKDSENVALSLFLFFLINYMSTMNGIRQSIVVAVMFACVHLLVQGRTIAYIMIVAVCSMFHVSVLIMIPMYYVVHGRAFRPAVMFFAVGCIGTLFLPTSMLANIASLINDGYTRYLYSDRSINIFRLCVTAVPVLLSLLYVCLAANKKKDIPEHIHIFINMITIGLCFSILAAKVVFFARIGAYFDIYSLIVLPYMIQKLFHYKERALLGGAAIILYSMFFFFQLQAYSGYLWELRLIF